jgi:CRP/FNR family transcriptional regulator, nitrogen oxide reductase regulator
MGENISIDLFGGMSRGDITAIEKRATTREFSQSETIVRSTEPANRFFLIKNGHVDYFIHAAVEREVLLRRLTSGDVFGFGAFFSNPTGYFGTAIASGGSTALMWSHQLVRQIAREHPKFVENALRIALRYFEIVLGRHAGLVASTAQERLALALVDLGSRAGQILGSGVEVLVNNEELAALADVNIYTASRTLKAWERRGALAKSYGKVLITSPERLLSGWQAKSSTVA